MKSLLKGKVAIITGAAGGLGSATARRFIDEGAQVVVADINDQVGEELTSELGANARYKRTDVSIEAQMRELVDYAVDEFGQLDIMFNNAGFSGAVHPRLFDDDFADFDKVMSVNLFSVMTGSRYAAMAMKKQGAGSIINTTSLGALNPGPPILTYRAAKAGIIQFSQSIARDVAEYGIRVNCIAPGRIPAGMTFYDMSAAIAKHQPLQRQGTPDDVAWAALYLASDMSLQVTGLVIPVDGGANLGGVLDNTNRKV